MELVPLILTLILMIVSMNILRKLLLDLDLILNRAKLVGLKLEKHRLVLVLARGFKRLLQPLLLMHLLALVVTMLASSLASKVKQERWPRARRKQDAHLSSTQMQKYLDLGPMSPEIQWKIS